MAEVAVLGADVLIGHLDASDSHHDRASALLRDLANGGTRFAASTVTLAKLLVGPVAAGRSPAATAAIAALEIEEVALGEGTALRLATLRADSGCRLPDCCVLLAAEASEAALIATFDAQLGKAAQRLGISVRD